MAYIIFHLQPIPSESKSSSDVFITGQNYILVKFFLTKEIENQSLPENFDLNLILTC